MANKQNKSINSGVKREHWAKKYVWTAREQGKLVSWRNVKGSKLTRSSAETLFKSNGTFKRDVIKVRTKLTNFTETVTLKPSKLENRNKKLISAQPKGRTVQYLVQARYKGSLVAGRSGRIGSPLAKSSKEAKERAWESFINRLSEAAGFGYDEDEGIKLIDKVVGLQEGWVVYK